MVRRGEHHHHYNKQLRPQSIVDGLRTGNAFSASGQLIDRLAFVACVGHGHNESSAESAAVGAAQDNTAVGPEGCATMGEKLVVSARSSVAVAIRVREPSGASL